MAVPEHEALAAIAKALVRSGFTSLDDQAAALGLPRSTAWTIVSGKHKRGRLHANTTMKLLANPSLPLQVRAAVEAYATSVDLFVISRTARRNRRVRNRAQPD